jgi:TRAP-type transport system small permease protein
MLLVAALTLVVVAGVVFRKLGASLVWYDEVASILLVWLTYYGSCLVALDRAHIGFPNLVRSLNPPLARALVLVREVVVIGFFAVLAWAGWRVLLVLEGNYLVSLPWMPTQLTQSVIPIGSALFIVAELVSLFRNDEDPEHP